MLNNSYICYVARLMGFVPMVFFGQWGLPFGVPKSRPLTVVVGSPLEVPMRSPLLPPLATLPVSVSVSVSDIQSQSWGQLDAVSDFESDVISSLNRRSTLSERTPSKCQNDLSATPPYPSATPSSSMHTTPAHFDGSDDVYEPSDAEVEGYLDTFITALEKLYEDHSELYGMGHVKLVIM